MLNYAGATICKCLNRATATLLAGALGVGVNWVARQFGATYEPIIVQASVFVLGISMKLCVFVYEESGKWYLP